MLIIKFEQSNIKLAIIKRKIPSKAVFILIDIARLYTFSRVCAFGRHFCNKVPI